MLVKALRRFRESLRRVTDGAEAFLILTLFILCLDKVSTDHAKLVPLGKVCTAKESLEKNTAKGTKCKLEPLISLIDDHSLLSKMAALESCPKHNMIAYLEKTEGNVEFHEVIDFLQRSYIFHALTVSPVISTTFVEQFWTSAKSKTINNVRHITAKVAGKLVSISEASIRTDLLFDDADGIDTLPNQAIFDAIQLMGYEGDLTVLTFNKALFSPQWRFLFHTINHCLSSKSTSWDQIPTNVATAVICLTTNQKYNFSKLIFDGMFRHLEAKKKFVMYPRFISIFLAKQLVNVTVPLDHFPVNSLTSKVFSFMVKKGKHFSGKITPLFDNMLVHNHTQRGCYSKRLSAEQSSPSPAPTSEVPNESLPDSTSAQPSEVPFEQQPDPSPSPSPRPSPQPSPTPIVPDSIPEPTGENLGDHSSNDTSLLGNEDDMTLPNVYDLCISLCKQVSDQAKEIKILKAKIKKLKKQAKPVIKHFKAYLKTVSLQQRLSRKSSSKKQRMHKKNVSKQGRKIAKGESSVQRDPMFDVMPEDNIDHMEAENAQSEGRTKEMVDEDKELDEDRLSTEDGVSTVKERVSTDFEKVSTDFEKVSTDKPLVSTDGSKVSTDEQIEGADDQVEGTEENNEGNEEIFESTEEQRPGTEEKVESTAGQIEGTEDQTKEEFATQASQTSTQTPTCDEELARKVQEEWEAEEEKNKIAEEEAANEALIKNFDDHVGNNKHDLKSKKFEDIQALYEKIKRFNEDFISTRSAQDERFIKRMNEKGAGLSKSEVIKEETKGEVKIEDKEEESTRKRKQGTRKKMKSRKRRYIQNTSEDDSEKEDDELKLYLSIVQDEEKEVDYEILDRKYPIIDWKTVCLGTKPQFDESKEEEINLNVVTRSNGQERYFSILTTVLSIFDREDLNAVYQLVMDKYQDEMPEGFERVLWGDLMVLFNPDEQDEFWSSQHESGKITAKIANIVQGSISDSFIRKDILSSLRNRTEGYTSSIRISDRVSTTLMSHTKAINAIEWSKNHPMGPPEPSSSGRNRSKRSAQQNQIGAEPHDASNSQNVRRRLLTDYVNIAGAKSETVEQCLSTKDGQTRFIHSQDMGLLDFVKSSDPSKIKTGEQTLALNETPLMTETTDMVVNPSPQTICLVTHTNANEINIHSCKNKMKVGASSVPPPMKKTRMGGVSINEHVAIIAEKSPVVIQKLIKQANVDSGMADSRADEFVSSFVTPTPEHECEDKSVFNHDDNV
ncbi:hypothetical protein Tco_1067328 [Tanacetum coccineum]|uniref:Uncharacterized protein n=1 Tax=Tanacetum coccineum TaxID=301880 RepID=A0ABQ5HCI2_9ASTR